jgi:hypothetical protein
MPGQLPLLLQAAAAFLRPLCWAPGAALLPVSPAAAQADALLLLSAVPAATAAAGRARLAHTLPLPLLVLAMTAFRLLASPGLPSATAMLPDDDSGWAWATTPPPADTDAECCCAAWLCA